MIRRTIIARLGAMGKSRYWLARQTEKVGMTESAVYRWLSGNSNGINVRHLDCILTTLSLKLVAEPRSTGQSVPGISPAKWETLEQNRSSDPRIVVEDGQKCGPATVPVQRGTEDQYKTSIQADKSG